MRGIATGRNRDECKARSRVNTGRYQPGWTTRRSPRFGAPRSGSTGRKIIAIWPNLDATYFRLMTLVKSP